MARLSSLPPGPAFFFCTCLWVPITVVDQGTLLFPFAGPGGLLMSPFDVVLNLHSATT